MDTTIFHAINGVAGQSDLLDALGRFGAEYLPYLVLGLIAVLGLIEVRRDRRSGFGMAVAGVIACGAAGGIALVLSTVIDEARPFVADPTTRLLIAHAVDSGFPSDHVTIVAAAAAVTSRWYPRLWPLLVALVFVVAVARVFVGVHYPGDVVAAGVIGLVVGMLTREAVARFDAASPRRR